MTLSGPAQKLSESGLFIPSALHHPPTPKILLMPETETTEDSGKENAQPNVAPSIAARRPTFEAKKTALANNRSALDQVHVQMTNAEEQLDGGDEEPGPPSAFTKEMPVAKPPAGESIKLLKSRKKAQGKEPAKVTAIRVGKIKEREDEEVQTVLRKKPSEESGDNLTTAFVEAGWDVTVTQERVEAGTAYYKLKLLKTGRVGWIKAKYLSELSELKENAPAAKSSAKPGKASGKACTPSKQARKRQRTEKVDEEGDPVFPSPVLDDEHDSDYDDAGSDDSDGASDDEDENEELHPINELLSHRVNDAGVFEYLVDWLPVGREKFDPTWEPAENLAACDALNAWMMAHPEQPPCM